MTQHANNAPSTQRRNNLKPRSKIYRHQSACTGKDCPRSHLCARANRKDSVTFSGPLLHMFNSDCKLFSRFAVIRRESKAS
ncbi:hypothetical protein [uncultured Paraglaciecola sp.]|uniref:hypothetical protein n=1 Tax=uncultured Paraglaciecola sp. TaxID=1765024 RepID=UPI0026374297|nr:hypothetical protein [uncultured Paraglaciecola sp.]